MFAAVCIHLSGNGNLGLEFFFSNRFSLVEQQYASKAGTAIAGKQQCGLCGWDTHFDNPIELFTFSAKEIFLNGLELYFSIAKLFLL